MSVNHWMTNVFDILLLRPFKFMKIMIIHLWVNVSALFILIVANDEHCQISETACYDKINKIRYKFFSYMVNYIFSCKWQIKLKFQNLINSTVKYCIIPFFLLLNYTFS